MRIRWWHSIRWRLAIGSMLVALLATVLLALAVILAIIHYYSIDENTRLASFASDSAQRIGARFVDTKSLVRASAEVFPNALEQSYQGEQYLIVVVNHRNAPIYPHLNKSQNTFTTFEVALADPTLHQSDFAGLRSAIVNSQRGVTSTGELGSGSLIWLPRPFVVQPIFLNGQSGNAVVGVVVVTPTSAAENTVPPFIAAVGFSVLLASVIVAVLAVLAAILYARTITRPLANLTKAAHVLASGDYNAQVTTRSYSELDELAQTFNEMAAKLASDVRELQEQELWRRELIMNITHDLATPLTAIAGLGESLVDGVNQSREDYEATGRIIVREMLRLRRLVKDLHMMAKVEAGAVQPQWKAVRLAPLVDEVLAMLATEFERADVEPLNAISYNLPVVQADPDMLKRIFSNLCDNALRHTPSGGRVVVDAVQQDKQLLISVTDSGEGIPTAALPRVFDRFYRADSARRAMTGGSGLGLAIVRAIIEAHGGTIWAENVPDGGARLLFTLPLGFSEPTSITSAITAPISPVPPVPSDAKHTSQPQ
ncbi:MAG TPA: ATP-binding protein [Ktedonobacteraceae bacterium]|nr:ATP-binding protein [Ktedonobacteraceae bacterium]